VTTHAPLASALPTGVPLVLGVTGHREFRPGDEEPLRTLVTSVIGDIRLRCAHTPLILLTPLAEGADRLVAKVALDAGAWLVVPMPFARATYEATFRDDDSRRKFAEFLTHPRTLRVMPLDVPECVGADRLDEATRRRFAYLCCGAFVARHSQLLIALWDGARAEGMGGTAAIVDYRRTGHLATDPVVRRLFEQMPEPFAIPERPLDAPEFGPVYHIVTPRPGPHHPEPHGALTLRRLALTMYDHHPAQAAAYFAQLEEQWDHIDAWNEAWPADARPSTTSPADREPMIAALAAAGAGAGALARTNQGHTYAALTFIFAIVFAAAVAFEGYAHLVSPISPASLCALTLYVALLAVAYLRYRDGRIAQTAFQDHRALAEGLRVQLAWRRAGLPHSVGDHYLRKHADELTWIRDAVDAWSVMARPADVPDLDAAEAWMLGQEQFYSKAAARDAQALEEHRQGGVGWVSAGVSVAVALVIGLSVRELLHVQRGSPTAWGYLLALAASAAAGLIFVFSGARRVLAAALGDSAPDASAEATERDGLSPRQAREILSGWGLGVLTIGVVSAVPWMLDRMRDVHAYVPSWIVSEPHPWIVVALGLVTLIGAFHHTFAEQRAFGEHRNQYERMAKLFERGHEAFHRARAAGDPAAIERLLILLGTEALAEHADWLVLHRERPLQIPKVEL
jgi:hypothetical protein